VHLGPVPAILLIRGPQGLLMLPVERQWHECLSVILREAKNPRPGPMLSTWSAAV
jgi:hypothetical protein